MDAIATLVWIAPASPDVDQSRALASWARAHGVTLSAPKDEHVEELKVDLSVAREVETLLERAHDALAAGEGADVERAVDAADALLRAHPELPQSSWLMAEVERARATRWRRLQSSDPEAADRAWVRAEALDGGRVAGVGEEPARAHAAAATLVIEIAPRSAQVLLDGVPASATNATQAGPHSLVVTLDAAPTWAEWIEIPSGSSTTQLATPDRAPCSSGDLAAVRFVDPGPREWVDAGDVRCPLWAVAVPVAAGTEPGVQTPDPSRVRIATCEGERCGALLEWRAPNTWTWSPPAPKHGQWPVWATWGLVGAGAAVATAVVLVVSGALQSPTTETHFISGGIKTQ